MKLRSQASALRCCSTLVRLTHHMTGSSRSSNSALRNGSAPQSLCLYYQGLSASTQVERAHQRYSLPNFQKAHIIQMWHRCSSQTKCGKCLRRIIGMR